MSLTNDSLAGAVKRKTQRAHEMVKSAEGELEAANDALKDALPRKDLEAIADAAQRTVTAEEEVREAAQELEVVNELLENRPPPETGQGLSGEGAKSVLPWLKKSRS